MNQTTKRSKELKEVHVGRNEVGKSVTGISLNKDEGILNVGETEKLIATVEPTDYFGVSRI